MVNVNVKYMSGYYNSTSMATSNYSTKPSTQHLSHTVAVPSVSCYSNSQSVDWVSCRTYKDNHMLYHHCDLASNRSTMVMSLVEELSPFLSRTSLYRYVSIQPKRSQLSKLNEYVMCKCKCVNFCH